MYGMHSIQALLDNYCIISIACAWILAQIIKVFTGYFQQDDFSITKFFCGTGGMPSAHSATVMALVVSSAWEYGFASYAFAISVLLATIVMSDAMGVRLETGKQAKIINQIIPEIFTGKGDMQANLKELIGHTPFQVMVGAILGVIVAVVLKLTVYR